MVNLCDIFRTTRPEERVNAVDLDLDKISPSNRPIIASESSSSCSDSDEFEDSKSDLSGGGRFYRHIILS